MTIWMGYNLGFLACSNASDQAEQEVVSHEEDSAPLVEPENQEYIFEGCMEGFVPIPTDEPVFCMMSCEAHIHEGNPLSQVGVLPNSNVSFYQAQEYCSSLSHAGISARLPRFSEWMDAGDGQLGEGGSDYPWGDDFHSGECVLPTFQEWDSHQVCGFLETCISPFGVYDQIGNLWEWLDTQLYVDIAAWLQAQQEKGRVFSIQADETLVLSSGELNDLFPFAVGLSNFTLLSDQGKVMVQVTTPFREDLPGIGYLRNETEDTPSNLDFLPIYLAWDEARTTATIKVSTERDFEPIPAKVGGAYYSGGDSRLDSLFWGHVPSFDGSIGFRCVYEVP